ncbi:MAG: neuraminidase-like domain-containing protein [Bacteroidota bacterium]
MNKINFPLHIGSSGKNVADLHKTLTKLIPLSGQQVVIQMFDDPAFKDDFQREVRQKKYGKATQSLITQIQEQVFAIAGTGEIDQQTAGLLNIAFRRLAESEPENTAPSTYQVHGTLRDRYQLPIKGANVNVYDKSIRSQQLLGQGQTDESGYYNVRYEARALAALGKQNADAFIEVTDHNGNVLYTSGVSYNAPVKLTQDVNLGGGAFTGPSLYEQVASAVTTNTGKIAADTLREDDKVKDISYLNAKTDIHIDVLTAYVLAQQFSTETKIRPEVFFGLMRRGLPGDILNKALTASQASSIEQGKLVLDALKHEPLARLTKALSQAIADNAIPKHTARDLDGIREQLQTFVRTASGNVATGDLSNLISRASLADLSEKQLKTLNTMLNTQVSSETDLWQMIAAADDFDDTAKDSLRLALKTTELTHNSIHLAKAIIKKQKIKSERDLHPLAEMDENEWKEYLDKLGLNSAGKTTNAQLAKKLAASFGSTYPSAALKGMLKKSKKGDARLNKKLIDFLHRNPDFHIVHSNVNKYIPPATAKEEDKHMAEHLKKIQRVHKLTKNLGDTQLLMDDGIHSARQVYFAGRSNFINKYSTTLSKKRAERIYKNAKLHYTSALNFAMRMKSAAQASAINVFPDYKKELLGSNLADEFPNLKNLLLDGDSCVCDECSSVYGAAAYLTDILEFLGSRNATNVSLKARDILFERRPDIADIDLNCDNTNTVIPYTDIVNELLEDHISGASFTISKTLLPKIKKGAIDHQLLQGLHTVAAAKAISNIKDLSAKAVVSAEYSLKANLSEWVVRDKYITLKLSYQSGAAKIHVRLLRQALLTADEIAAHPEYTNAVVYTGQYLMNTGMNHLPFSLPYDLAASESSLYLQKLGVNKYDLIKAFRKPHEVPAAGDKYTPNQYAYAFSYLDVNHAEQDIIFKIDATQSTNWPDYNTSLYPVDTFLSFTGLMFDDMLTLLTLKFINPSGNSEIVSTLDPTTQTLTCNTSEKSISKLSNHKFDAIRRFLRVWRKTSLSMEDMDRCIMSPAMGNGVLDKNFAVQLQSFLQLQNQFSLSTEQLLAFYQDINSTTPDALYFELFQNRSNPLNPDFTLAKAGQPVPANMDINDILLITGALSISSDDLALLVTRAGNPGTLMGALSFYYRYAMLAQSLSLSVSDLLDVIDLIVAYPAYNAAADPFTDPVGTNTFLGQYNMLALSGFTIADLNYLLLQKDPASGYIPDDNTIAGNLAAISSGLLAIIGKTTAPAAQAITATNANTLLTTLAAQLTAWLTDPVLNWDPVIAKKIVDILSTTDDPVYPGVGAIAPFYPEYDAAIAQYTALLSSLCVSYTVPAVAVSLGTLPDNVDFGSYAAQISYNPDTFQLRFAGNMTTDIQTGLLALSVDAGYQGAVNALYAATQTANPGLSLIFNGGTTPAVLNELDVQARFLYFFNALAPAYQQMKVLSFIQNELTTIYKVDKNISAQLVRSIPAIVTDLANTNFVHAQGTVTAAAFPQQYKRYKQLSKIAFVVNKLAIQKAGIAWLLQYGPGVQVLDLQSLPLDKVTLPLGAPLPAGSAVTFDNWRMMINLFKLSHYYPVVNHVNTDTSITQVSIFSVLQDFITGDASAIAHLLLLTGLDELTANFLLGYAAVPVPNPYVNAPNPLQLNLAADMSNVDILLQLHTVISIASLIGASADNCVTWTSDQPTLSDAENIIQALKSQYQQSDWTGVTQPLQDQLRQQKRDALVSYILATNTNGWQNTNDLYDHFLLDVEMNPVQTTSRIVQATNTVQLFVQRCFMNLEQDVVVDSATDDAWPQWKWMQYYRLWEANREVFVYPENWIDPTLLPVKSPFFTDLQNALQQNAITNDNVASYYQDYLVALDGVARLEIKGMWYQDDEDILHVFGRTYGGDPHTWYYRQLLQNSTWTPWQNVKLDIKGDYIIPVVYNRRIYLFWPVFTMQQDVPNTFDVPDQSQSQFTATPPPQQWKLQMAFSELKNGKWSPKILSTDSIDIELSQTDGFQTQSTDKSQFLFIPLDFPDVCKLLNDKAAHAKKTVNKNQQFLDDFVAALQGNSKLVIGVFQVYMDEFGGSHYDMKGAFEMDPCRGYPVLSYDTPNVSPIVPMFDNSVWVNQLDQSDDNGEELSVNNAPILDQTIGQYNNLMPLQVGFFDKLFYIFLYKDYWMKNCGAKQSSQSFQPQMRMEMIEHVKMTLGTFMSFFYQDGKRTYYVAEEVSNDNDFEFFYDDFEGLFIALLEQKWDDAKRYIAMFQKAKPKKFRGMMHFYNFYHPLTCYYIRQLYAKGIDGLLSRDTQAANDPALDTNANLFSFETTYGPSALVYRGKPFQALGRTIYPGYPTDDTDFNFSEGYANYNWELFFHVPLLIAESLSQNQQFEDATKWFNYIFNPTDTSSNPSPQKYWVTKPFFQTTNTDYFKEYIDNLMVLINNDGDAGEFDTLTKEVGNWRADPFEPHDIARFRTVAYQKNVVMKFVQHLIAYGDYMFMQDTMETVNQATQLYVMASEILGPKPQQVPPAYELEYMTYNQLHADKPDSFSNALVEIENLLPLQEVSGYDGTKPTDPHLPALQTLYFCIPQNDQLMTYWDTIENRLYNIRNGLNIDGIFSPLSLFAPPIDPGALVRAAASGLDISSILSDMNTPLPYYRFQVMLQKAIDLCNDVKGMGNSLLSALEKKDSEGLALLRSQQEIAVQQKVLLVKQKQLDESNNALSALQKSLELNDVKIKYYTGLIAAGWNTAEITSVALTGSSIALQVAGTVLDTLSSVMHEIPDIQGGASGIGGSPHVTVKFGGQNIGDGIHAAAAAIHGVASSLQTGAGLSTTIGSFQRRAQEWQQQLDTANKEKEHINVQMEGAKLKISISEQEVKNQELQISNSEATDAYMHSKYTNQDLYSWMISQISNIYFSSYNLAYKVAKSAEQCYRYELGLSDSSYIKYGYWDSLNKGLLSGEKLMADIKQLEMAYFGQNKREYELTKHVSLALLDPTALMTLKENGRCFIDLPEELFDMDYPGQYMRRLRSVSITIPCVAGPYITVACTLTLMKNSIRTINTSTGANTYPRKKTGNTPADDKRFRDHVGTVQTIVTSNAVNDGGLFDMSMKDERYLPFEGAGAVSSWMIELPSPVAQFNYETISDLIIHLRYTSREGGDQLGNDAATHLRTLQKSAPGSPLTAAFSAKRDFPTEWYRFLNTQNNQGMQELDIDITSRLPYIAQASGTTAQVNKVTIYAGSIMNPLAFTVKSVKLNNVTANMTPDKAISHLLSWNSACNEQPGKWQIDYDPSQQALTSSDIDDIVLVYHYSIQ